jgi:hypothetical protein
LRHAVENAFHGDIDYAQLHKIYASPNAFDDERRYSPAVCTGIDVRKVNGNPDLDKASTSYVERQNLTMRMGMRRFTRLTNGFSKKVENLAQAVSLHYMYYNFARPHTTLTKDAGGAPPHPRWLPGSKTASGQSAISPPYSTRNPKSALLVELYKDFFELADVVEDFQVRSQHLEKCLRQVCGGLPVVRDERIHQLAADGEPQGHFDLPKFLKVWVFGLGHQSSPSLVTGVSSVGESATVTDSN